MVKHLFSLLLLALFVFTCKGAPKHPVVLVPGLGASKLYHKKDSETYYSGLWVQIIDAYASPTTWLKALTLDVNNQTGDVTDQANSTIKACCFGNPKVLTNLIWYSEKKISVADCDGDQGEYTSDDSDFEEFMNLIENGELNLSDICATCERCQDPGSLECKEELKNVMGNGKAGDYYYYIVHALEAKGYTANKDIKGAPYDFRKAPDNLNEFYRKLKKLVEDLYHANQNVPVVMIAHSMGNPVLLNFYNHKVTKEWKDTYIHAHVALAPPWAGSIKSVRGMVSGDSDGIPLFNGPEVRPMQRSWPGIAWMMPSPIHELWNPEEHLVVTPHRNYSVKDYNKLFHDMGYDLGFLLLNRTRQFDTDLSKLPELRALHVLYGANVDTPIQYIYPAGSFPDKDPQVKNGKGDGTVNTCSLEAFKGFKPDQSINLTHHAFEGVNHMEIIQNDRVLKFITDLVLNYEDSSADELSEDSAKTEL